MTVTAAANETLVTCLDWDNKLASGSIQEKSYRTANLLLNGSILIAMSFVGLHW